MPRRAARKDANHAAVVAALEAVGAAVLDLASLPGALDLLAGYRRRLYLLEIKDGAKAPSRRQLTSAEAATLADFARHECPVHVVTSAADALRVIGATHDGGG